MPVRSLSSSIIKWPSGDGVRGAARRWVKEMVAQRPDIVRVGYFGSYARGDWGVGSDLDMIIVVKGSDVAFEKRATQWDTTALPVPVDLLVYTTSEWESLEPDSRFCRTIARESVWLYGESASSSVPGSSAI